MRNPKAPGWALLWAILATGAVGAREAPPSLEDRYWATVAQYRRGDRSQALATISKWSAADLLSIAGLAARLEAAAKRCPACDAAALFLARPLRSAALMHAERERMDRLYGSANQTSEPDCTEGLHGSLTQRLLRLVSLQDPAGDFGWRLSLALSLQHRASQCFDLAREWADRGAKTAPDQPDLLFARGMADESSGTLSLSRALEPGDLEGQAGATRSLTRGEKKGQLERARDDFLKVTLLKPSFAPGWMRLGRVWWQLGRRQDARAALEKAVALTQGPEAYLPHLFLGRVLDDLADQGGALREYETAATVAPGAQSAGVAIASLMARQGDSEGARGVLEATLAVANRAKGDAFWDYLCGEPVRPLALIETLRRETR